MQAVKRMDMNPRVLKGLAWTGPALVAAWLGALLVAGFIPPDGPAGSAQEIADSYAENTTTMRIAVVLLIFTGGLWATWGAMITTLIRRMEGSWPGLTYAGIALVGGGYVFFIMVAFFWGVAAFRPGETDPLITQAMHDLGWFNFLFTAPPFILFNVLIAIAIFQDRSVPTVFPRWVAYACLWAAFIFIPADAIIFFKTGPLAWDGFLALYIPLAVFFGWMCAMTYATLQAIKRAEAQELAAAEAPGQQEPASKPVPVG